MTGLTMGEIFTFGRRRFAASTVTTIRNARPVVLTFAEIADRAERLAQALLDRGVGTGDVIVTVCRNHHEHLEVLFASHLLGTVFAPLNPRADKASLAAMVESCSPAVVVADADMTALLDAGPLGDREVVRLSVARADGWDDYSAAIDSTGPLRAPLAGPDESALAAVLFTGGTTGIPKGATYTQQALYLHTVSYSSIATCPLRPDDTVLALVPICHGLGWNLPQVCWLSGIDLVFIDGSLPADVILRTVEQLNITASSAVPTVWNDVAAHAATVGVTHIGDLRTVVIGGAMTPSGLPARLRELGVTTYVGWGMTETLPATLSLMDSPVPGAPIEPDVRTSRPNIGVQLRTEPIAGDSRDGGALLISAPWVTGQYLGLPAPQSRWFDTGDIGEVGAEGQMTILGRAKEMIKSGGEAIWPGPIEDALLRHPGVAGAAVIEIPHERWGGQPLAIVHLTEHVDASELRSLLLETLPKWQVPTVYAVVPEIPRTAVGKADKLLLATMHAQGSLDLQTAD
ncbi:AMP-binding protein [Dactylosporangium sp. CA-092794]|uniref:AMP-binding protein n=1 Tax=Dactylosporangium sp. CA-092794 TaxID=3239929 RepID=UPI003D8DE157